MWCTLTACATLQSTPSTLDAKAPAGWHQWRGPDQDGSARGASLPLELSLSTEVLAWSHPLSGRGTPVTAGDRLYALGYEDAGQGIAEVLVAIDIPSGERLWTKRYPDFLSDIIYERYSIGSPVIDGDTGRIYLMTSPGLLAAVTPEGETLWERSLMETLGRLTFPNGRTGAPVIVDDLVVVHGVSTSWGALGPGRDRLFAFHKESGELAWVSTPGTPPKDSSFSTAVAGVYEGRRVLYVGTGCGHVVCVSAEDGAPLWRFKLSHGGINASPLVLGERVIGVHGKENIDSSHLGRMVAIDPTGALAQGGKPTTLGEEHERWRADVVSFTSSPVHHEGVIYQTSAEGNLVAIDAQGGEVLWRHKLGRAQLHASPLMADGVLYVPMQEGVVHVLRPERSGPNPLSKVQLEGKCIGSPAAAKGRLFVHTTEALYAFGSAAEGATAPEPSRLLVVPPPGPERALQLLPFEVIAHPGDEVALRGRPVDALGRPIGDLRPIKGLTIPSDAPPSAKRVPVKVGALEGALRLRVVPKDTYREDFEGVALSAPSQGEAFSHPPGFWSGAKMKWRVVALDEGKALAKTLDRVLFQRATSFFGHPEARGYTLEALVRSDGNRRSMGVVGVVNQRYIIALDGNRRELSVHSNHDRFREAVPFKLSAGEWMHLKTRVDMDGAGGATIRAKAWPKGADEPGAWTLVAVHAEGHHHGAPGLFGFSPQSQHRVYIDEISMRPSSPLTGATP